MHISDSSVWIVWNLLVKTISFQCWNICLVIFYISFKTPLHCLCRALAVELQEHYIFPHISLYNWNTSTFPVVMPYSHVCLKSWKQLYGVWCTSSKDYCMREVCSEEPLTSAEGCDGPVVYHCLHIVCSQGAKVCPLTLVILMPSILSGMWYVHL